ncbi:MAG: leucine-rich repeat domain-containing protein [Clostridia bacterium]|nr:leucine-rich repeat domain-containing protein [Clostridia bacterium]
MTKRSTKHSLLLSALSLLLCASMLIGTTFAWFTDSVTSTGNIIKSGTLEVALEWAEGNLDPATTTWNDASDSTKPIFNNDLWEPGYTESKHVKISNNGSLAFNYMLRIVPNGTVSALADVIDVYYFDNATQLTRADVENGVYLGTLTELFGTAKNISNTVKGTLYSEDDANGNPSSKTCTIALKMKESAGNEYQDLAIGSDFNVEVIATQLAYEIDSFDKDYDIAAPSPELPSALVRPLVDLGIDTTGSRLGMDIGARPLDVGYQFEPTESYADAQNSEYRYWHADFAVKADAKVPANSMALAGYYDAWCSLNNDKWVALASSDDIAANTEIRLVASMADGLYVNYEEICRYGNDGKGFQCGAVDLTGENVGTTLTVEFRLYETLSAEEAIKQGYGNTTNVETGNYIVVGEFEYTFGGDYETLDDGAILFNRDDGKVILYDTQDATIVNGTYTVPEGVTTLGNYSLSHNDQIETVVLPETVTSLGRAFDSSTSVKKVVLNEGLETIDSRAFKSTTALEEVVIPSTVTTIADNAFQKSGIKNLVIPATVETIGETAFGASLIETITFEGNTSIQGYAFRGCTELRKVYLNGDDVTFIPSTLNGRNSCWFCNGESNNPNTSNIDFYVINDTVAAGVKTAMGAEANNTDVYVNGVLY